jgi:hypothetical protein
MGPDQGPRLGSVPVQAKVGQKRLVQARERGREAKVRAKWERQGEEERSGEGIPAAHRTCGPPVEEGPMNEDV